MPKLPIQRYRDIGIGAVALNAAVVATAAKPLKRCAASSDGECGHAQCPQLRDNEPAATGRHCPLDNDHDKD